MDVEFQSHALARILRSEIAAGNSMREVSEWPPKCKTLIILSRPFLKNYDMSDLEYNVVNAPYYWLAEYRAQDGEEVLACGFEKK